MKRINRKLVTDSADLSWAMIQGDRNYNFDANLGLSDGAAALTASGYTQYAGANGICDMGGNQNVTVTLTSIANSTTITPQQARIDVMVNIYLTAIYTGGGNKYIVMVLGSNDPAFGAGNVQMLGGIELGTAANLDVPNGITTPAPSATGGSQYEIPVAMEQNNVKYEYLALYVVASGATPSITMEAYAAPLMRE